MAGNKNQQSEYYNLLFLNLLFKNHQVPLDALNAAEFVRVAAKKGAPSKVKLIDSNPDLAQMAASFDLDLKEFKRLASQIIVGNVQSGKLIDGQYYPIPDSTIRVDWNRGVGFLQQLLKDVGLATPENVDLLSKITLWDALVFSSVFADSENSILEKIQRDAQRDGVDFTSAEFVISQKSVKDRFYRVAFESYILPAARAEAGLHMAANVFSVCESQLSAGRVPAAYQPLVYELVDETANGLAGQFNDDRYNQIVGSLSTLKERSWARVLLGAALVFAGVLLAGLAIALAVHSFGVSTPLSAVGVATGVDLMMAGMATIAALSSFGMAGIAGFFAASKHQKTELTEKAEAFYGERADIKM